MDLVIILTNYSHYNRGNEEYPPMNTARSSTAVVSSSDGEYIIVIGGLVGVGDGWTATVELFQICRR